MRAMPVSLMGRGERAAKAPAGAAGGASLRDVVVARHVFVRVEFKTAVRD